MEAAVSVRLASSAIVYLRWSTAPSISTYTVRYKFGRSTTSWTSASSSGNELVVESVPLNTDFVWEVSGPSDAYLSATHVVSTSPQTEPIKVSPRMYNQLEGWFSKENNTQGFCDFLPNLDAGRYEKLSFIQAYFFNNASFTKPSGSAANTLTNWYPSGTTTENLCVPVSGCNCKVISKGSNLATPNNGYDNNNYLIKPKYQNKIIALSPDGDEAVSSRYEAGAAKFVALKQNIGGWAHNYSMSNLQGADDASAVTTEGTELVFFLACLTPSGQYYTLIPSACACERPLHVYYQYTSRAHIKAEKKSCIWSKGAEATAEDLAYVSAYSGKTGSLTAWAAGHSLLSGSCKIQLESRILD